MIILCHLESLNHTENIQQLIIKLLNYGHDINVILDKGNSRTIHNGRIYCRVMQPRQRAGSYYQISDLILLQKGLSPFREGKSVVYLDSNASLGGIDPELLSSLFPEPKEPDAKKPKKIDFIAARENYVDHLEPIYKALPTEFRGDFVVNKIKLLQYCRDKNISATHISGYMRTHLRDKNFGPLVLAGLGGYASQINSRRPLILLNHGAGQSWNDAKHPSYAGGIGRSHFKLILEPGDIPAMKDKLACPRTNVLTIGCPKMDRWYPVKHKPRSRPPVVAIGFHQDTKVTYESRSAFHHYEKAIPKLVKWHNSGQIELIGAGHPAFWRTMLPLWEHYEIEPVADFDEVMRRADVYVRDQMSTIYEFASLDRPVVVLNAPWYRRKVEHGIRFWEYANVGVQCNEPDDLIPCIKKALEDPPEQRELRHRAVNAIYKYMDGKSTQRAVEAILELCE